MTNELTPADPAKAFHIAADLADDIEGLRKTECNLRVLAEAPDMDERDQGAILCVAEYLESVLAKIDKKQGDIFHSLHGCAYPDRHEPEGGAARLSRDWRDLYDAMHEGQTFPLDAYSSPEGERLEGLEKAIADAPIHSAHDALAKLRLWLVFKPRGNEVDGKIPPGTPCKTVGELEAEVLADPANEEDGDYYAAQVYGWLHAICEGEAEEGGAS